MELIGLSIRTLGEVLIGYTAIRVQTVIYGIMFGWLVERCVSGLNGSPVPILSEVKQGNKMQSCTWRRVRIVV